MATTGCGVGGETDGVFLGLKGGGGGQSQGGGHSAGPSEDQILKILGALTNLGKTGMGEGGAGLAGLQGQVGQMPGNAQDLLRSEERRVGKECRSRWSPDYLKKNKINTTNGVSR